MKTLIIIVLAFFLIGCATVQKNQSYNLQSTKQVEKEISQTTINQERSKAFWVLVEVALDVMQFAMYR